MAIGVTTLESRFVIPRGKAVRNLLSPASIDGAGKKQIPRFGRTTVSFVAGYRFSDTAMLSGFERL